uniref:Uncharacterized protein n=1 Tax=Anopheles culicifacies TaxID=139723 RepID=A0A182M9L6_9DIPT
MNQCDRKRILKHWCIDTITHVCSHCTQRRRIGLIEKQLYQLPCSPSMCGIKHRKDTTASYDVRKGKVRCRDVGKGYACFRIRAETVLYRWSVRAVLIGKIEGGKGQKKIDKVRRIPAVLTVPYVVNVLLLLQAVLNVRIVRFGLDDTQRTARTFVPLHVPPDRLPIRYVLVQYLRLDRAQRTGMARSSTGTGHQAEASRALFHRHDQLLLLLARFLALGRFRCGRVLGQRDRCVMAPEAYDDVFPVNDLVVIGFERLDRFLHVREPYEGVPGVLDALSVPNIDAFGSGKHLLHRLYRHHVGQVANEQRVRIDVLGLYLKRERSDRGAEAKVRR